MVAIVGGSKVSTKLTVLECLSSKVDQLVVGGGNTFLLASGKNIGKSLAERDLVNQAKAVMAKVKVPLPTDVVCAKEFSATAAATIKSVDDVADDDMILDIGPVSAKALAEIISNAGTVVWSGPVGVFEMDAFANGTKHWQLPYQLQCLYAGGWRRHGLSDKCLQDRRQGRLHLNRWRRLPGIP